MTKDELITNLLLLGFNESTLRHDRYKRGEGASLIIVECNVPHHVLLYTANNICRNRLDIPYEEALGICVKLLSNK